MYILLKGIPTLDFGLGSQYVGYLKFTCLFLFQLGLQAVPVPNYMYLYAGYLFGPSPSGVFNALYLLVFLMLVF
ncbi:hypothetical protein GDO86_015206 [Hymenochirus boettgeri]|uniref:Uncharacterized protein n=1 Tax=Hymenochirus boettgeri TaxID=247094 RepID=A0A8T2JWI6_9PIPI|nr:hypothetical protein GDO86_015206 [Hymenochirus boettgeri]